MPNNDSFWRMPTKREPLLPILRSNKVQITIFPNDGIPTRAPFVASFEKTKSKLDPCMGQLIAWEFGRQYESERRQYVNDDSYKKLRHIPNDYDWWLKKRSHVIDRRELFTRHLRAMASNAAIPNMNLSAFVVPKLNRPLRIIPAVTLKRRTRRKKKLFGRSNLLQLRLEELNK